MSNLVFAARTDKDGNLRGRHRNDPIVIASQDTYINGIKDENSKHSNPTLKQEYRSPQRPLVSGSRNNHGDLTSKLANFSHNFYRKQNNNEVGRI